jgi:hypothetical protein
VADGAARQAVAGDQHEIALRRVDEVDAGGVGVERVGGGGEQAGERRGEGAAVRRVRFGVGGAFEGHGAIIPERSEERRRRFARLPSAIGLYTAPHPPRIIVTQPGAYDGQHDSDRR